VTLGIHACTSNVASLALDGSDFHGSIVSQKAHEQLRYKVQKLYTADALRSEVKQVLHSLGQLKTM